MNRIKLAWANMKKLLSPLILMLLAIMFLVEFVKGAVIVSILPVYMQTALGISTYMIGWTLAVLFIGDNLFRSPIGWLIDKIGFKPIMIVGVLLTFLSIAVLTMFSLYFWIVIACALLGVGTSPLWPCVITAATRKGGKASHGKMMSVIHMSWLTGVGLGPVLINFFIGDSYTTAFRILIALMVVAVILTFFIPNDHKSEFSWRKAAKFFVEGGKAKIPKVGKSWISGKASGIRRYLAEANKALQVRWVFYPALFAQTFALGLLTPVLTLYARTILNLTPAQYSYFLIAGGAVTVLALLPAGKLVDRFGPRWFIRIGLTVSSLTLLTFTFIQSIPVILSLVVLIGVGYALLIPSWNALIASIIPEDKRGAMWGFFLTIEGAGNVIGPILSGKLWDSLGYRSPLIASGITLAVMFVLQLFIFADKKVMVR